MLTTLTATEMLILAAAGIAAGISSTVVGLASLVSYPALLSVGLPALDANMTNTAALVFVAVGAGLGSRTELAGQSGRVARVGALALVGGAAGACLLLTTPPGVFELVVPWLVAAAGGLMLLQPRISRLATGRMNEGGVALAVGVSGVGAYLGYFGAGGGVALLALLGVTLPEPLPRVNAVKNVGSGFANLVAAAGFAAFGPVDWVAVAPLASGLLVGGAVGPLIVRRLPVAALRLVIAVGAFGLAVKLAWTAYG